MYKEVGRDGGGLEARVGVGSWGGWAVGNGLYLSIELFQIAVYESKNCWS